MQEQYWMDQGAYGYVPVLEFSDAFRKSQIGRRNAEYLQSPYDASKAHGKDPLVYDKYALNCEHLPPRPLACVPRMFGSPSLLEICNCKFGVDRAKYTCLVRYYHINDVVYNEHEMSDNIISGLSSILI